MHRLRETLRQKWGLGRTHREIARSVGCSVGAVWKVVDRASAAGLELAAVDELDAAEIETRVQGVRVDAPVPKRELPDFAAVHREHMRPSVTLELLHLEYLEQHPDGYRYTQFCELYRRRLDRRRLSMRQVHRAGEKSFVDYAGQRPHLVDPKTGECTFVELFVMVLGASNLTYAKATMTQRGGDFIASHMRGYEASTSAVCRSRRSAISCARG